MIYRAITMLALIVQYSLVSFCLTCSSCNLIASLPVLAFSVMSSLDCIWKKCRLPLSIKIRGYLALVQSVLLYASETWTLTSADAKSLEAFHMKCQRRILRISWRQFVHNSEISVLTGLSTCHHRRHPTSSHRRLWPHRQTAGQHPST